MKQPTMQPPHAPIAAMFSALFLALSAWSAQSQITQPPAVLTPPSQRISDEAIQADHATYEATQARIQAVNAAGRPLRDYHLAKAQCWLDVSWHEYTRNDRSAFPQLALSESAKLLNAIQAGVAPLPMDTPMINNAARLRQDLWAAAAGLRSHAGWSCAQAKAACAEVELVHAGNEFTQQQWRHAKPYVQIAEDLVAQSQVLAERCLPSPPPPPPVIVAVAPLPPPPPPNPPGTRWASRSPALFCLSTKPSPRPARYGYARATGLTNRMWSSIFCLTSATSTGSRTGYAV